MTTAAQITLIIAGAWGFTALGYLIGFYVGRLTNLDVFGEEPEK